MGIQVGFNLYVNAGDYAINRDSWKSAPTIVSLDSAYALTLSAATAAALAFISF